MDSTHESKVAAGAALLDRVEPDWARKIDPSLFVSCEGDGSIFDQLYGSYWIGVDKLRLSTPTELDMGFRTGDPSSESRLLQAWKAEITSRLTPQPSVVVRSPSKGRAPRVGVLGRS